MKNFNEKYTVRDFIDKNKWSNVYEGINNETNEKIILNIITSLDKSEEHMSYFKEEINTLMSMNNSNLISINDMSSYINKDKTYYYIESEYFEGLNLKELKESIYLDKVKSLEIIREVIKGIKEFNDREINYGILKEENIIINKDGIVKLDTLSFINRYEGYLNCEEIKNRGFDYYEDIYMIGKILCKLITGKSTFNLKENNEELDVDLMEILMKSTNIKHVTKHKYKDLDEFLGEVTSYIEHGDINYKNIVNLEKINYHKLNFKAKYIGAIFCAIVIISGIAMGSKYILNNTTCPIIIDADGLNVLKDKKELLKSNPNRIIITPHLGEMSRLTGYPINYIRDNKVDAAKEFANKYKVVVLLKGYETVITNGKYTYINPTGNSSMANGGMGDTLLGMITSFVGQGMTNLMGTVCAAYIHGYIGQRLSKDLYTVNASDVINLIPQTMKELIN